MQHPLSKNGIHIRLTDERWLHISMGHPEITEYYFDILETIESPELIYEGYDGGLIAIKKLQTESEKYVVVIYKEVTEKDGFIITAFFSRKKQEFQKKKILWKQ